MSTDKPKTQSLKMPMDVIEGRRIVAAFRGQSMADRSRRGTSASAGQDGAGRDGEAD